MRRGYGKILLAVFLLAVAANLGLFVYSGGIGLARIVWYYLIPDMPDKKFGWDDFRDRGPRQEIKGFYSGGDETGFYLWTLSGLKRFNHQQGVSVYLFHDVCAALRALNAGQAETDDSTLLGKQITGDVQEWRARLKKEYLVTVVRLEEDEGENKVDKALAVSGRYKVPGQLTLEQCD